MFMALKSVQSPSMSLNPGIKMLFQVCMSITPGSLKAYLPQKDQYHKESQ